MQPEPRQSVAISLPVTERALSDEHYVLDLCEQVLGSRASRQHRFDWLLGDTSPSTGRTVRLPVDAYWPDLGLVVEFRESQHFEATPFFDKPDRLTVSGVDRGEQRRKYDERRDVDIPSHGLRLVVIRADDFPLRRKRLQRTEGDADVVRRLLDSPT